MARTNARLASCLVASSGRDIGIWYQLIVRYQIQFRVFFWHQQRVLPLSFDFKLKRVSVQNFFKSALCSRMSPRNIAFWELDAPAMLFISNIGVDKYFLEPKLSLSLKLIEAEPSVCQKKTRKLNLVTDNSDTKFQCHAHLEATRTARQTRMSLPFSRKQLVSCCGIKEEEIHTIRRTKFSFFVDQSYDVEFHIT